MFRLYLNYMFVTFQMAFVHVYGKYSCKVVCVVIKFYATIICLIIIINHILQVEGRT